MQVRLVYQIGFQRVYSEAVLDDELACAIKRHVEENLPRVRCWLEPVASAA